MSCKIERDTQYCVKILPSSLTPTIIIHVHIELAQKDENKFTSLSHVSVCSFHIPSKESIGNPYVISFNVRFYLQPSPFLLTAAFYDDTTQMKHKYLNKYTLNKRNTSWVFFFFLPCKAERSQMLLTRVPVTLYSNVLWQLWLRFISCCCHYAVESAIARSGLEFLLFCFWSGDEGTTSPDAAAVQS